MELRFRDPIDFGVRARHVGLEVTGGLGGLVVDLRDVPLRLPDRLEPRRDLLASWQGDCLAGVRGVSATPTTRAWLDEVVRRRLVEAGLEISVPLPPGDRPLVEPGTVVAAGDLLLEHVRDRRVDEVDVRTPEGDRPLAGSRWAPVPGRRRSPEHRADGELLSPVPGKATRWRLVTGEHRAQTSSVVAGIVVEVRPGAMIRLRVEGLAIRGAFAAGASARGRLELATDPFGDLRPGGIDVGRTGSILVVGSRIDAEALTRARAMGVRGIVAASVSGKELRDFQASEHRQRAALHMPEPFGVLALDGTLKRPDRDTHRGTPRAPCRP